MKKLVIHGGVPLTGTICISGAKNSAVALVPASLLSDEEVVIDHIPDITDIDALDEILVYLGAKIKREGSRMTIQSEQIENKEIPEKISKKLRASYYFMGALLGKYKKVEMYFPGGCAIGKRPIDQHIKAFEALGAKVEIDGNKYRIEADELIGTDIYLGFASVGATINALLASVKAKGKTTIHNAAKEPEIVDLQNFINKMGGKIIGAGTDTIIVEGVESLSSCEYTPMADRIIAGTYLLAGATCGGDILVKDVKACHIYSLLNKLKDAGFDIKIKSDSIRLASSKRPVSFGKIETMPYPGFPTDMQPQALVLQTISSGVCIVTENLFETRLKHVPELVKMGANITMKDRMAIITGVDTLYGTEVCSTDLRAGAALTIAGMHAQGQTVVTNIHNIDRGYEKLDEAFCKLGADIKRV